MGLYLFSIYLFLISRWPPRRAWLLVAAAVTQMKALEHVVLVLVGEWPNAEKKAKVVDAYTKMGATFVPVDKFIDDPMSAHLYAVMNVKDGESAHDVYATLHDHDSIDAAYTGNVPVFGRLDFKSGLKKFKKSAAFKDEGVGFEAYVELHPELFPECAKMHDEREEGADRAADLSRAATNVETGGVPAEQAAPEGNADADVDADGVDAAADEATAVGADAEGEAAIAAGTDAGGASALTQALEHPIVGVFTNADGMIHRAHVPTIMAVAGKPLASSAARMSFIAVTFGDEAFVSSAKMLAAMQDEPDAPSAGAAATTAVAAAPVAVGFLLHWNRGAARAAMSAVGAAHIVVRASTASPIIAQTPAIALALGEELGEWNPLSVAEAEVFRETGVEFVLFIDGVESGGCRFDGESTYAAQLVGGKMKRPLQQLQRVDGKDGVAGGDLIVELIGMPPAPEHHAQDIDLVFHSFDGDGSGTIEERELSGLLAVIGAPECSEDYCIDLIKKYAPAGSEGLAKDGFSALLEGEGLSQTALLHVAAAKAGMAEPRVTFTIDVPASLKALKLNCVIHPLRGKVVVVEVLHESHFLSARAAGGEMVQPGDQVRDLDYRNIISCESVSPCYVLPLLTSSRSRHNVSRHHGHATSSMALMTRSLPRSKLTPPRTASTTTTSSATSFEACKTRR